MLGKGIALTAVAAVASYYLWKRGEKNGKKIPRKQLETSIERLENNLNGHSLAH